MNWLRAATPTAEPDVLPVRKTSTEALTGVNAYTDAHIPAAESLRAELKDAVQTYVLHQRSYAAVEHSTDPTSRLEQVRIAPLIAAAQTAVQTLALQIAKSEDTIRETEKLYAQYVQRVAASTPTVETLEAALKVLHEHLDWSATESAYFDRTAADLLARTGDRHAFRRPRLDPRRTVRDGVEELLEAIGTTAPTEIRSCRGCGDGERRERMKKLPLLAFPSCVASDADELRDRDDRPRRVGSSWPEPAHSSAIDMGASASSRCGS